jgi:Virulence protein RhuM family
MTSKKKPTASLVRSSDAKYRLKQESELEEEGKTYDTRHYNLSATITVGYKVSPERAVAFRKRAMRVVEEFTIMGFPMDDERLKRAGRIFERCIPSAIVGSETLKEWSPDPTQLVDAVVVRISPSAACLTDEQAWELERWASAFASCASRGRERPEEQMS